MTLADDIEDLKRENERLRHDLRQKINKDNESLEARITVLEWAIKRHLNLECLGTKTDNLLAVLNKEWNTIG